MVNSGSLPSTKTYSQYCAVARSLDRIGDRWTLLVVRELLVRPMRFAELAGGLPGIATNLLTDRLRRLEHDGIIERRVAHPSGVEYHLTEVGHGLRPVIEALVGWGATWMPIGRSGQQFQPHWLEVALPVIGAGRRVPGIVRVDMAEGTLVIRGSGRGLAAVPDDGQSVDATLVCTIEQLLSVVTGATTVAALVAARAVSIDGDTALADTLLGPVRSASRASTRRR